jgi:hypothetical protein
MELQIREKRRKRRGKIRTMSLLQMFARTLTTSITIEKLMITLEKNVISFISC